MAIGLAMILATGCATQGGASGQRVPIDQLHLLTIPRAINFDGAPGADGIAIKIYGSRLNEPKPIPISRGQIEILLFDGVLGAAEVATKTALRAWRFDGAALRDHQYSTSIGVGYQFALPWGDARPTQERITVVARFLTPEGRTIMSLPSPITVNVQ